MTLSRRHPSLHCDWIATTASAVIKSCGLAYCVVFTSSQERPGRPIPQALRRLPYSSASYAGGLDQAMERSKWLLPFLLVDWTTASAAIMTKSSGFAYFMVFTSFFLKLGTRSSEIQERPDERALPHLATRRLHKRPCCRLPVAQSSRGLNLPCCDSGWPIQQP
jgi:hypothetical protein